MLNFQLHIYNITNLSSDRESSLVRQIYLDSPFHVYDDLAESKFSVIITLWTQYWPYILLIYCTVRDQASKQHHPDFSKWYILMNNIQKFYTGYNRSKCRTILAPILCKHTMVVQQI